MKDKKPALTRKNTLETFMKANTKKRIGKDSVIFMLAELNKLGSKIVKTSSRQAEKEQRNTILERDIKVALKSLLGGTDIETLFKSIDNLSAKETANLTKKIKEWLIEH